MNQESFEHLLRSQLPIAWIAGVRLESYDNGTCKICVEHDFLNQNPFGSMFWAVQGMAAEFAGGMMLTHLIEASGKSISYLVVKSESTFHKKRRVKSFLPAERELKLIRKSKMRSNPTPLLFLS